MEFKLNNATKFIYADKHAKKVLKYKESILHHYFKDCLKNKNYKQLKNLKNGEKINSIWIIKNPRMKRGYKGTITIDCIENGKNIIDGKIESNYNYIIKMNYIRKDKNKCR